MASPRISRRRLILLAPLVSLLARPALGAQLEPRLQGNELGLVLRQMRMPPTFRKDLVSGLTNRILVQVSLLVAGRPGPRHRIDIAVKYDLWEETFSVRTSVDSTEITVQTCRSVDDVISVLGNLTVPRLFLLDPTYASARLALGAEVLFDPVERARLDEIRKWVAENDRPAPADPTNLSAGLPATPSASARVFNRIFQQYAAGAPVAAAWKESITSAPFLLTDLRREP